MSVNIIYGRSGSGKSRKCIDIACNLWNEKEYGSVYLIVPEQFTYTLERQIVDRIGITSPKTLEVLSLKRFYYYAVNLFGKSSASVISSSTRLMALKVVSEKLSKKLKILGRAASYQGFCNVLSSVISEFKHYKITPEILRDVSKRLPKNSMLALKTDNLAELFEGYEKLIENTFLDPDDDFTRLAQMLNSNPGAFKNATFIFDEFSGFTVQETEVIYALIRQGATLYFAFCSDSREMPGDTADLFFSQKKTINNIVSYANSLSVSCYEKKLDTLYKYTEGSALYHIENCLYSNINYPFKNEISGFSITEYDSDYTEINALAAKIINFVRDKSLKFRDIAVTTRDIKKYAPLFENIFAKYNIPFFLDNKENASIQPGAGAILSALDIYLRNYSYESVFNYIKSGFSPLSKYEGDLLENYVLAFGIRGNTWTRGDFTFCSKAMEDNEKNLYLQTVNDIRVKFTAPLTKLFGELSNAENAKEMCKIIHKFLLDMGCFEKILSLADITLDIDRKTSAICRQLPDIIIDTLNAVFEITGNKKISIKTLHSLIKTGISSFEIGAIPVSLDAVTIGSVERSRTQSIKVHFIIGMNDGSFPKISASEGILNDEDRKTLIINNVELAPDTASEAFFEQYNLYKAATLCGGETHISYPLADSSGSLQPSLYIYKFKKMFPGLIISSVKNEDISSLLTYIAAPIPSLEHTVSAISQEGILSMGLQSWFLNSTYKDAYLKAKSLINYTPAAINLSSEALQNLYTNNTLKTSISRIETFNKCPFSYYSQYSLKALPRKKAELKSDRLGSLMHEIIERIQSSAQESENGWHGISKEDIINIAISETDRVTKALLEDFDYVPKRLEYNLARLKNSILSSALMVWTHLKCSSFVPLGYEITFDENGDFKPVTFDIGSGKKVKIRGKVDRADTFTTEDGRKFLRIIDYKSGNKHFSLQNLYHGFEIQLAVYLDALCENTNSQPAGMLYFHLYDPLVNMPPCSSDFDIAEKIQDEYKMNGLVLARHEVAEAMDNALKISDTSRIIPVSKKVDGDFKKLNSLASMEQIASLRKHINKLCKSISADIMKGKTNLSPIKQNKNTSCEYCNYKEICHFDLSLGCSYRNIEKFENIDEVWNKIKAE